jgi:molybdenum cofactor cytidylyltransferase
MIAAVVLAAGQSRRMGRNKLRLPFGTATVIETVIAELVACELGDIVVVTGHEHEQLTTLLAKYPVRCVFNADYRQTEMIGSIQAGLRSLSAGVQAALIVLGDQPRLERGIVRRVIAAHRTDKLVIPSFERRRGHPILLPRTFWSDVLALPVQASLHDVVGAYEDRIRYVEVDSDSVIRDMDTPEDYAGLINRTA